ncbi:Activator of Hsp90 ATPase 1 family protein [Metarhizium guizhouense ARSEF 977]|uniref:Activator of Hsp90 ATPase 1 family protein n=1 Tax=Metarhizium guizhouense (strain ARSEF 977) TaxID=1276136 RepID=A0A0B4GGH9_METGA|nr:Activator of Hsp90 ATPase 1 family protein [Metarhizium guizhouense ARSEF 977]
MQVNTPPSVNVGVLIRRPPHAVFEALADPSMTTRFWYVHQVVGTHEPGHNPDVGVGNVRRLHDSPSTVEFRIIPCPYHNGTAYLRVVETGFTGHGDSQVKRAAESTAGFTFVLSALKAALEHDVKLSVTADAFRSDLSE